MGMKNNNYAGYAALFDVSKAMVERRLGELKKEGKIVRVGGNKVGYWKIG